MFLSFVSDYSALCSLCVYCLLIFLSTFFLTKLFGVGIFVLMLASAVEAAPVDHIVAFNFLPSVDEDTVQKVAEKYLALKELCVDPNTNQTYIVYFSGGVANSKEGTSVVCCSLSFVFDYFLVFFNAGFQQHMRLVFRMTLPNEYFRDYFVGRPFTTPFDPHHDAFKQFVGPLLNTTNGVIVLDFTHNSF